MSAQLPAGYKQTEVGLIPEDWASPSIKEIAANRPNAIVGGPFGSDLVSKDYVATGVPVVRGKNMAQHHVSGDFVFVSRLKAKHLQANTARANDIIFTQRGTLGQISIVPRKPFEEYIVSQSQMKLTLNADMANSEYVYQYFVSARGQKQILDSAIQTGVPHTNLGILRSYRIPAPPTLAEQQAIAEALSDADALVESLEQLLAKKRQIKQGAMQELLTGQKRLPGFAGEWDVKCLGQLADIRIGGTPSTLRSEFWDGDILWCTPTDITGLDGYKYLGDTSRKITALGLKASSAEIIPAMSVVMTSRATIGECAINRAPLSTNQGFKNFVPFDDVDVEFLYYLLTTQKQGFISLCGGSTFMEIGKTQLAIYEVVLPSAKAEQTAIATILSDMDAELAALEARLVKARQLKQGMMQELLTGRIRLLQPRAEVIPFPEPENAKTEKPRPHNRQIEEAVMLGVLAKAFGSEQNPLARVRRTKLLYLLHRYIEGRADGYLKKAAGPYNPKTRYQGAEGIAVKNAYVRSHRNGTWEGFVAGDKVAEAEAYFDKWHEPAVRVWLEQFHYTKTEELELLATVDMVMEDLHREGNPVALATVKQIIASHPEWQAKLEKPIFSDANIERAITKCHNLFGD